METLAQKTKSLKAEPHNKKKKGQQKNSEKNEQITQVYQNLETKLDRIRATIEG